MSENIHRADLDPLEMALAVNDAIEKGYYKNPEAAAKGMKKSKSFISKLMKVLKLEHEIIRDLERNKSTSDIEALYLIQRLADKKIQVKTYYDFVQGKIDRAGLRSMTSQKSFAAKHFVERTKKSFKLDLSSIEPNRLEKISKLLDEIERILE